MNNIPDGYEFALCLTHDVDRPYKTFQAPYYALTEGDPTHLKTLVTSDEPYWQFENIMSIEEELGVRSSFYFLNEQNLIHDKSFRDWFKPNNWKLFMGRYNITSSRIVDIIQTLDEGGWEVGLHGSYESYNNLDRLWFEKKKLEDILGHEIIGGRQHYLNIEYPTTWKYHREIGLKYDASLGSSMDIGFNYGSDLTYPLNDYFAVFPLTIMEVALMRNRTIEQGWEECLKILNKAKKVSAVVTVLWHPRYFSNKDFPGYERLYRRLIETALEMNAWVGDCATLYRKNHD